MYPCRPVAGGVTATGGSFWFIYPPFLAPIPPPLAPAAVGESPKDDHVGEYHPPNSTQDPRRQRGYTSGKAAEVYIAAVGLGKTGTQEPGPQKEHRDKKGLCC